MLKPRACVSAPLQALSPAGRCLSFDASGDGYGRGEGIAVAILAPHRPGQAAVAVLRASTVNQDGQSSGLTAPNGPSQTKLVQNALRQGGLQPALLRYVAVHGTGTPLGDPIEVGALGQAVRGSSGAPLALGSVKSIYGHTEGTAGLTGLLLAACAASEQRAAPVMHLRSVNPYVAATLGDWRKGGQLPAALPRQQQAMAHAAALAGTSSFGMSGVNAHMVLSAPAQQSLQLDPTAPASKQLLHSQRLWPLAAAHPLLHGGLVAQGRALFSCDLGRPLLSHLWEQQSLGRSALPAAAALELMAAAGCSLSEAAAVGDAALTAPIYCEQGAVVTCSAELASGAVQLLAAGQVCATAYLPRLAAGAAPTAAPSAGVSGASIALLALQPEVQAAATANLAPHGRHLHGYHCQPSLAQAAITLSGPGKAQAVLGCQLYLPAALPAGDSELAATATGQESALVASSGAAALQLQGLLCRPMDAMLPRHLAAAPFSPAWQLAWQPASFVAAPQRGATPTLIVSTQPWPLASLCSAAEGTMAAVNAVWGSSCSGAAGQSELCISSEAHLEQLLRTMQPQRCLFVQPPGAPVDTAAALATYRAVARLESGPRLALVTYDQQAVGSFGCKTCPATAALQGEFSGGRGCACVLCCM